MDTFNPYVDYAALDTPAGMTPSRALNQISTIPLNGTGLAGEAYTPPEGKGIWSITRLEEIIATKAADASFTASAIDYGSRDSKTTLAEFLEEDASSITGNGGIEMGPSGLKLVGHIFIPAGVHEIAVSSDDGFSMKIGGVDFMAFEGARGNDETARVAEFDGGLYPVEILYFDGGGHMNLDLEIDGFAVHESAFWKDPGDLETTGGPSVPVADYHPSHQLGEAAVDDPENIFGTADADTIDAGGGDDTVDGGDGADNIKGGYGNDLIIGGKGNDVLEGGRGSDWLRGGDGDDLIVGRSDAGEQKIGQIVVGNVTRPDNGEVNYDRQKLIGWEDQALVADDIYEGGAGRDTFLITAQINAKLEIIEKHVRSDGSINWAGVAGENTYVHDHWTDSFGIDTILDYNAEEDTIAIIGHTAEICDVSYRDVDGDGDIETIITVWSNQSGPCVATGDATCHCAGNAARAGGAHDQDLIGQLIVHGDRVEEDDIITDAGVTFGIVDNISEVAEAIFPAGETKQTVINGDVVYGYDTRGTDGSWGAVTGSPEDHIDNPFLAAALANTAPPTPAEDIELTREPFGQIAELEVAGVTRNGTAGDDLLRPDMRPSELKPGDLPGALGFWSMANGDEGAYGDLRGELGAITAYELDENQAILRQDGAVRGPDGRPGTALSFNGKTDFAYLDHDPAFQVTMGTMAVWVRADDLSNAGAIVTKDQSGSGEGGHFRLVHLEDGNLLLRMAPGNGEGNKAWKTKAPVLEEGVWSHLAVSFNDKGVTIYENGRAIANNQWEPVEGNVPSPGVYGEAYMVQNTEPFVFGADQVRTKVNDTAQAFAADDDKLVSPFEGAMAGFGFWGGFDRGDVLTPTEVRELYNDGPGTALTAPSGTLPRLAGDDVMYGRDGNDEVKGWAGDDKLHGNDGNDTVEGHYGDDILFGGNGHDVLNGGRGSDLVIGGKGNDILIGGGDAGEDRLGQIVLDQNSRNLGPDEDPSISSQYLKLIDWTDQALVADDVYVGGEGNDHFLFETYINAKKDIILEHAMPNRMIHWHGVAGENKYLHDHWVDSWGIEIVADYKRSEDKISVLGHTVQIEIDYKAYDSDGDGVNDAVASIISPYSQQGKNGGAHDEDGLGHIVVFGDMVYEEDVITDAGVHYGIVDTLDELQEALAPTGEGKVTTLDDGTVIYGYDSRDVDGDPIGSDPLAFSENPYLDRVDLVHNGASTNGATVVAAHGAGSFDGTGGYRLPHHPAQALDEGTISFRFTADDPANGDQALYSKDHSGYKTGGHLTISLDSVGRVVVRMQDTEKGVFMRSKDSVEANTPTDLAFTFSDERLVLYIDGVAVDTEVGMPGGMTGNSEDAMLGASTRLRRGIDDRLEWFFSGTIEEVAMTDRALEHEEVILLDDFDSAISNLAGIEPYDAGAYTPREPVLDEGTPASSLMTFGLYDTETDKLVAELGQGAELDAAVLAGRPLAIVATPEEGVDIGSVRFEHDGSKKTESHLPFAQFGDWGGDLQGGAPYGQGDHTVKITAYEGASASGAVLETVDLSFSVVDGSGSASGGASGGSGSNSGGAGAPKMEVGTLSMIQQNEDAWYSVSFSEAIPDARVVMGPLSMNGDHPVSVRVRDITETGFEFQIDEWNYLDGSHGREEISWMAVSAGTHTLGSGQTISAGRTSLVDETPTTVQLAGFDDAPIVLTQVTTDNGPDAVVTRIRNVTEDRFSFKMQEEEALPDKHVVEAADWIAIEGGTAGRVDAFTVDGVTNQLRTVNFDAVNGELGVLGAMQTMNGPDTAGLRIDDATGRSLKVRVEEERSLDDETYHTAETVGLVTLGTGLYELA